DRKLTARKLRQAFGILILATAVRILVAPPMHTDVPRLWDPPWNILLGALVGALGGLLGVGGGTILVPILVLGQRIPQHVAQGVSLLMILPTGIVGALSHARHGHIVRALLPGLMAGGAAGALLGALLAHRIEASFLSSLFALLPVLAGLKRIDAGGLSDSTWIDYDLFSRQVEGHLFDLTEIRRWENDPSTYNYAGGIFSLVARSFAPPEARLRSVIARLRQVPRLLESGKQNIKNPPALFAQFAGEDFEGSIEFLEREVPVAFTAVKDAALLKAYEEAKSAAEAATRDYIKWMREDLTPRAHGSYVLGEERYRKKLHYDEMVDLPLDTLLEVGERELDRLEARYAAAAKRVNPNVGLDDLIESMRRDHASSA